MAQMALASIPREFEVTRNFEAQQADEAELKSLQDKLFSADMDADARLVLGKSIEQLSAVSNVVFLRLLWGRFGQFVQRLAVASQSTGASGTGPAGPVAKSEVTKKYSTSETAG